MIPSRAYLMLRELDRELPSFELVSEDEQLELSELGIVWE